MAQASITIAYVNQPKPGKTNGSIKGKDNEIYGVPPHMLSNFQPGATYTLDYSVRNFNGQAYKTVTTSVLTAPPQETGGSGGKYGNQTDATAERIFVCGALNAAISGGHVELSEVAVSNVVNLLRESWKHTFGASSGRKNDDMNDEVPF